MTAHAISPPFDVSLTLTGEDASLLTVPADDPSP